MTQSKAPLPIEKRQWAYKSANKSYELPFIDLLLVLLDLFNNPASIYNQEKKNLLDRITQMQGKCMPNCFNLHNHDYFIAFYKFLINYLL